MIEAERSQKIQCSRQRDGDQATIARKVINIYFGGLNRESPSRCIGDGSKEKAYEEKGARRM